MLTRLKPKGVQSVALLLNRGTRTFQTAGVQAGAYSLVRLPERNMVNPSSCLAGGRPGRKAGCGDVGQRNAGESQSRPVIGRIGVALSLRRASEQTSSMVGRYEKTCGTSAGGKANERGFFHVCVLGQSGPCGPVHLAPTCSQRQEAASQYRKGDTVFTHRENRLRSRGASYRLEPDDMKISRPVLRGGGGRKATSLPGPRHEVV